MTDTRLTRKQSRDDFGWHRRGYIPHFDGGSELPQFVTFRLSDSMPAGVLEQWRRLDLSDAEVRKKIESYLDSGKGACWLKVEEVAIVVDEALKYYDGSKYDLIAWVIMPNHVHLLLIPRPGVHLPDIMHSIKSYSAQAANKIIGRTGPFWQRESFDRYIRNERTLRP